MGSITAAEKVFEIIESTAPHLPSENVVDARDLLEHNEWGEALDLICTQLFEYQVVIPQDLYQKIDEAGTMMGMSPAVWQMLKELRR